MSIKKTRRFFSLFLLWSFTFLSLSGSLGVSYLSGISFAATIASDVMKDADLPEIRRRRLPEDNGVADFLCKFVQLMQSDISRALISFSLFSAGVGAFFGKLSIGWFFSFAVGAAVFFGSVSLLNFFAPYSDISAGCKCRSYTVVGRNSNGAYIKIKTMLDKNCNRLDDPKQTTLPTT